MTDQHSDDQLAALAALMDHGETVPDRNAPLRRRRRRRSWLTISIVLAVLLALAGGYTGWALNAPLPAPTASMHVPQIPTSAAAFVPLPTDGAAAIRIAGGEEYFDAAPTKLILTSGSDQPRTIASISKVVTALVVLDAKPLDGADDPGPTIWFSKADHDLYDKYYVMGATIAAMPIGSSMSEYDALATMLIPSACNYAEAIATWAYGSQSAFVAATRTWLDAHGLDHTTIVEPTGLSHENTSTPHDLLKIGKIAAADPVIAAITATSSLSLPGPGTMYNTNDLLGVDGITGLKTGNLGFGSFALLYSASVDVGEAGTLDIIGTVLDGVNRDSIDDDVRSTLDGLREGFHSVEVATSDQVLGTFSTPWGASAHVVVSQDARVYTWSDTPVTVTMTRTPPTDYTDGQKVGTLTWRAGPSTTTADVEIDGTIAPPTGWWRLTHPFELG